MKINNILNIIRNIHKNSVIIITDYNKFRIYNEDSYICNYIFKYDLHYLKYYKFIINKIEYLNYVKYHLKKLNINYIILDKYDGYNLIDKYITNDNNYLSYLNKSKIYHKRMKIINKIRRLKNENKINLIKEKIMCYE